LTALLIDGLTCLLQYIHVWLTGWHLRQRNTSYMWTTLTLV